MRKVIGGWGGGGLVACSPLNFRYKTLDLDLDLELDLGLTIWEFWQFRSCRNLNWQISTFHFDYLLLITPIFLSMYIQHVQQKNIHPWWDQIRPAVTERCQTLFWLFIRCVPESICGKSSSLSDRTLQPCYTGLQAGEDSVLSETNGRSISVS